MRARVKIGWVDEADLAPQMTEVDSAEEESQKGGEPA
jgi:hypothetical protein